MVKPRNMWRDYADQVRVCALEILGAGGNQGQQIRDEILHIMPEPKPFKASQGCWLPCLEN